MRSYTKVLVFLGVLPLSFVFIAAQEGEEVSFESRLSHTAVWTGDPFEYRIALSFPREVEIIRDNLKKENVNLDPFTVLDLQFDSRTSEGSRAELDIIFLLTTKETPGAEAAIPSINLYYATRRRGALGKGTDLETHTLVIPEKKVGLRSTLTSDSKDIRDTVNLAEPGGLSTMVWIPGWLLLGLVVAQTGRWVIAERRSRASSLHKRDRKVVEQQALNMLRAIGNNADGQETPEAYNQVSEVVKNAIKEVLEIDAAVLTPEELQVELHNKKIRDTLAEQVAKIVETCETARYAPTTSGASPGGLQSVIQESQKAISHLVQQ